MRRERGTGSALHQLSSTAGQEQRRSHPRPVLTHLLPVPAGSSLRPGWTRGSAKSPRLKFWGWHPGSHPAAQRRLKGFVRFPHRAGSFARKSKFINSAFQHEQTKAAELDSQISQGLSAGPSPASSPTRKDGPFPPSPSWPRPSSLSRKPGSGGACQMCCLGTPLPQLVWQPEQGSRAGFKKTRRGDGRLLRSGARANTVHSSRLTSQDQGPQISTYCLKPSLHKPMGQKVSNSSSCPCRKQLPHQ